MEDIPQRQTCVEWTEPKKNTSLASSTHGIYCSLLIDYLLSLSSGVNVPCLGNKNSLERQLPQVKLCSFPDRSLLSISIQTPSIYLGKLKQLFLNVGTVLAQTRAGDLSLSYLKGSKDEFKMTVARKREPEGDNIHFKSNKVCLLCV